MIQKLTIPIPDKSQPCNFNFFLTHYVFQPWVVEDNELVRLFKPDSGKFVLVRVGYSERPKPTLIVICHSDPPTGGEESPKNKAGEMRSFANAQDDKSTSRTSNLSNSEINWIKEMISWIFAVNDEVKEFYIKICKEDPILRVAAKEIYGAHLRTDPTVFESLIGVVVAQNVFFGRIYEMTKNLCQKFGESKIVNGKTYYTFPEPEVIAKADLADIRRCKVGYRDKYIKGIAQKIVQEKMNLDELRDTEDLDYIRKQLISLPGVGPYTAELTIAISFRKPVFHLDLFSREAMYTFYFKGKKVSDKELQDFVEKKWGKWKHYVMLLLTTNTDTWSKKLGINFRLKSAAKSPNKNTIS